MIYPQMIQYESLDTHEEDHERDADPQEIYMHDSAQKHTLECIMTNRRTIQDCCNL